MSDTKQVEVVAKITVFKDKEGNIGVTGIHGNKDELIGMLTIAAVGLCTKPPEPEPLVKPVSNILPFAKR